MPGELREVEVEVVERAIAWLRARTDVAGPVALMGVSRGSELAVLSASLLDGVDGVVAFAPSGIVWPALGERGPIDALAWTFRGKAVPYVSLGSRLPAHSADTPFASGRGG